MPNPPRAAGNHGGDGSNGDFDKKMAKAAGIVVFSGIAISILKALNPFNNSNPSTSIPTMEPLSESARSEKTLAKPPPPCCRSSRQPPLPAPEPLFQNPVTNTTSKGKAVEIAKVDTLWGLSTKYGVSIQEIKEANGLTSDTIYAGKKIIIPYSLLILLSFILQPTLICIPIIFYSNV